MRPTDSATPPANARRLLRTVLIIGAIGAGVIPLALFNHAAGTNPAALYGTIAGLLIAVSSFVGLSSIINKEGSSSFRLWLRIYLQTGIVVIIMSFYIAGGIWIMMHRGSHWLAGVGLMSIGAVITGGFRLYNAASRDNSLL